MSRRIVQATGLKKANYPIVFLALVSDRPDRRLERKLSCPAVHE